MYVCVCVCLCVYIYTYIYSQRTICDFLCFTLSLTSCIPRMIRLWLNRCYHSVFCFCSWSDCQRPRRPGFNPRLDHTDYSKNYLIHPCSTLSTITYGSRVKWSYPGKKEVPFPTTWYSSILKLRFWVLLDYGCQLYLPFLVPQRPLVT